MRKRKFTTNKAIKTKLIVNILITLLVVMGIGYSTLQANLGINGEVGVYQFSDSLYSVLESEAKRGGLARKYTGDHRDSFTEEPSKDIYHWYAENDTQGTQVLNKNNVIFAGHCWQIIRTTDTGGVKMIYNGEVDNGKCLSSRANHVGYVEKTSLSLSNSYYYGTSYTYDKTISAFRLAGTITTGSINQGEYTCRSTSETGTCSTLYLVLSASNYTELSLNNNSNYTQYGNLPFNDPDNSPSYVGYMYGDVHRTYSSSNFTQTRNFTNTSAQLTNYSLNTSYWYSDTIDYGNLVTDQYSLVNPYQVSSSSDYQNLVGKYTFRSSNQNNTNTRVYYIAYVNGSTMYGKQLENGHLLSEYEPIQIGDSVTDNGNGTYTLNNTVSTTLTGWYTNYANYKEKYTCGDNNTTCMNPKYITNTTSTKYTYVSSAKTIVIGKTKSGLTLTNTLLLSEEDLIKNPTDYNLYAFTCESQTNECTAENLRIIREFTNTGYKFLPNYYFGNSVTWDGTNYIIQNPTELYNNIDNSILAIMRDNHFFCSEPGKTTCSSVKYINHSSIDTCSYVNLNNGETDISAILNSMLSTNTIDSIIKIGIDAWYKRYLNSYASAIEDIIFCNDRGIEALNGWNPNGGSVTTEMRFNGDTVNGDLNCSNITDQFSVSNSNAQLTYKIGLMTSSELYLLNNNIIRGSLYSYWSLTPRNYVDTFSSINVIKSYGSIGYTLTDSTAGVRPVISLVPDTHYSGGNGSMSNPYIVDTN